MINRIGKLLSISAIGLLFVAYSNFIPTVFPSELVADYVKNHFLREILFGSVLAVVAIVKIVQLKQNSSLLMPLFFGSVVVLPFWIASFFGWSTGGLSEVWGENLEPNSAYLLHGPQVAVFYIGMLLLLVGRKSTSED